MSFLLYAITSADERPAGHGLGGERLETIDHRDLSAIVSRVYGNAIEPAEDMLWEFDQVLERLMAGHLILPVRFGSVVQGRSAVREMLRRRQAELGRALARVEGAVEFGLTACWRDLEEPVYAGSGTAYLLGRLTLHRRASEVARSLHPLTALCRSSRQRVLPRPTLPVTASYLVEEERSQQFVEAVAHLDAVIDDIDVVCTGPWPPYSFVEGVGR